MKHFFNSLTKTLAVFLSVGLCVSCSDTWDDHYSPNSSVPEYTILELMSLDEECQNFIKVLQTTKVMNGDKVADKTYAELLGGDQFLTVWAQLNNSLTEDEWRPLMKENKTAEENTEVARKFLNNHISRYKYPNDGMSKNVVMMSTKHYIMTGKDIHGAVIDASNIPATNGIMHTLSTSLNYNPSIYEYLTTTPEYCEDSLSLGKFLARYTTKELDLEKSISAGYYNENDELVYADSVMVEKSVILDQFGYINCEDSTYYMIISTGDAWIKAYDEAKDRFVFNNEGEGDSLQILRTQKGLLTDAVFNMNPQMQPKYNAEQGMKMVSTTYDYKGDADAPVHYHIYKDPFGDESQFEFIDKIQCSNGVIYVCEEWPFQKSYTYEAPVIIEGESDNLTTSTQGLTKSVVTMTSFTKNDITYYLSRKQFRRINGKGAWDVSFRMENVLSGWNEFYFVVAPGNITPDQAGKKVKKNQMKLVVSYPDETGKIVKYSMKDAKGKDMKYENDVEKLDTIYGGVINIPNSSFEQQSSGISVTVSQVATASTYSKEVFLDCIIVKPTTAPATEN